MKSKNKKSWGPGWIGFIVVVSLVNLMLLIAYLVQGKNIAILNPKGQIAQEQFELMVFSFVVMIVVAIPTFILLYGFAWKYRESNSKRKDKTPEITKSKGLVFGMWLIPSVIVIILASAMIPATYRLEPRKIIAADAEPLTIQVVSLRWKWLFIYPEQKIASVNFVQLPINTPVTFELTADEAPMSSFWIPNLGGQLYSMTGHVNRLNLIADQPGDFPGSSAEINGEGFSGMRFNTRVGSQQEFDQWVEIVSESPDILDQPTYNQLIQPSESNPPAFFSDFEKNLYDNIVIKYRGSNPEGEIHH